MNRVLARIRRPRLLGATILTAVVLGAVAWGFHDPALAAVDLARARWCADNGRLWLGVKLLDRFLAVESGHQEARALRARLYVQLGQPATLAAR